MKNTNLFSLTLLVCALFGGIVACGEEKKDQPKASVASAAQFKLADEPGGDDEYGVYDARAEAPIESAVVVGRVAEMTKGFAAFRLVDAALDYCGQKRKDECPTPWDYCCEAPAKLKAATISVQLVDANGKVAKLDWGDDLRPCDLVALEGKVTKDEHGNVTVVATKYFRSDRPEFNWEVRWP
jgi:hypothetical protein